MSLSKKLDLESLVKQEAENSLKKNGVEVSCPFCKEKFVAKEMNVTCPHCSKTLDVEFNIK